MNILVAILDYGRDKFTQQVIEHNTRTAGYPFMSTIISEHGISRAMNTAFSLSDKYDALFAMSNDILMPDGWLRKAVEAAKMIPHSGVIALHCVEKKHDPAYINDVLVYPGEVVFGNALYPKRLIESVGHMNEDYDPYGMQDSDYCHRAWNNGFINYYLDIQTSEHIGHDVGEDSDYRRMKDKGLMSCGDKWMKWTHHYKMTENYSIFYNKYKYPESHK